MNNLIKKNFRKFFFLLYSILNLFNFHYKLKTIASLMDRSRMFLLKIAGAEIGAHSLICANVLIINPENLKIGNNSKIGSESQIFNYNKITIGDYVEIGTQFYINTDNHSTSKPYEHLVKQGSLSNKINIGSDIWIGSRVTILSGVKIEDRVVIGAGSVVTSDLKSGYMYAGVPAKIKKALN